MLPLPLRSPALYPAHANISNSCATTSNYVSHRSVPQQIDFGHQSQAETPRSLQASGALCLPSPGAVGFPINMAAHAAYSAATTDTSADFPWPNFETLNDTLTCEGHPVTFNVHAKVEKGFFQSSTDQKWTCYRRNYFCVQCSYDVTPNIDNGTIWIKIKGRNEQVQAIGLRLAAVVDDSGGKSIPLVQHTAKRDAGPKCNITVVKVAPSPASNRNELTFPSQATYGSMPMMQRQGHARGVRLPLQDRVDGVSSNTAASTSHLGHQVYSDPYVPSGSTHLAPIGHNITHQFERVQFKQATANNGKRRASQQYFHLLVELMVDVRQEGASDPVWVKVAQRVSEKIVVRGRSPSHYQNEGNHGSVSRNGSTGGAGGYSNTNNGSYVSTNTGAFRPAPANYNGGLGGPGGFRSHDYSIPGVPEHSVSPESAEENASEPNQLSDDFTQLRRPIDIQNPNGYQYFPSPLFEVRTPVGAPPPAKIDSTSTYATEVRRYYGKPEHRDTVAGTQWHANVCGRFQGVESSQGYYPNMSAGYS
nr:meiosis-specific transcription factor ndt80 [Quercus suber]